LAAFYFIDVVLLCDELKPVDQISPQLQNTMRFYKIARRLPMEIQMLLCKHIVGLAQDIIQTPYIENAIQQWLARLKKPSQQTKLFGILPKKRFFFFFAC